jgi:hypothetical protein
MRRGANRSSIRRLTEPVLSEYHTEGKSHTLADIIRSARMIIVAPLVHGAYQIPMLTSNGHYSEAIKCAGTASITFLILAISLLLADSVINRLK